MKFLPSLILLSLSAQALASPYVNHHAAKDQRDVGVYEEVIVDIRLAVDKFNKDIFLAIPDIHDDFDIIIAAIQRGMGRLGPEPPLIPFQARILIIPSLPLKTQIKEALRNVIRKRAIMDTSGLKPQVAQDLRRLKAAAQQLSSLVLTKVPAGFLVLAQQSSLEIMHDIDDAIYAYS
ncbi:hypothetical protein EYB25_007543 [Talaromyces marneffei]|uniref:Mp1p-like protein 7 n=1 Tax=Talaromyces marneffei (strain ATCC 18224 / CBS 334.59 / QM 7333) TaxID=441960 RepID=B6QWN9_TALMQ|nr:conserved hypothetical protein [Talaromyces marneffei ATCC 18224]KAE8549028.1 hypothetical protein EYB25_007543 [Talaromyces marneffei]